VHSAQRQQQQNDPGFTSHADQILNPPEMGPSQGQPPLDDGFVRPEDAHSSSTPSAFPSSPTLDQLAPFPSTKIADLSLLQLRMLQVQVCRTLMEGEEALQASRASTSGGEGDVRLQLQLRAKLEAHKQRSLSLQELINAKARARRVPVFLLVDLS